MNTAQVIEAVKSGKIVTAAEFRSAKAERREWKNRETGQIEGAKGIEYNLEIGGQPHTYSKRLEDNADLVAVQASFPPKGTAVLLVIDPQPCLGVKAQRGTFRLRVEVIPFLKAA